MAVKGKVPQENLDKGLNRIARAYNPKAISWADTCACATAYAPIPENTSREFDVYDPLGAGIHTISTEDTLFWGKGNLHPGVLCLRAVAEDALKWTPLEEDHTANTRAIFETVPLDINYEGKVVHL